MPAEQANGLLQQLRGLVLAAADAARTDQELLNRYLEDRDESAFAALVHRHGGMVWGVCRRLLSSTPDAEDAFQASFLILARKAGSIRRAHSLGSWLHGVALRISRKVRASRDRSQAPPAPTPRSDPDPAAEVSWREVQAILDEELGAMPERYRAPLLLCYLEGLTQDEAARRLGWEPGVLRGRLDRGRVQLRARLSKRGVALSGALLGAAVASPLTRAAPAPLVVAARAAVGGSVSANVVALTDGVLQAMFMTKMKVLAVAFVLVCVGGLSLGLVSSPLAAQDAPGGDTRAAPPASKLPGDPFAPTGSPGQLPGASAPQPATGTTPSAQTRPGRDPAVLPPRTQPRDLERRVAELEKQVAALQKLVDKLQPGWRKQSTTNEPNTATTAHFTLKHINATEAARVLADLFGESADRRISASPASNTLHVHGTREDLEKVAAVLTRIDAPGENAAPPAPELKTIELGKLNAPDAMKVLQEIFTKSSMKMSAVGDKTLVIYGTPQQIADVVKLIRMLDQTGAPSGSGAPKP